MSTSCDKVQKRVILYEYFVEAWRSTFFSEDNFVADKFLLQKPIVLWLVNPFVTPQMYLVTLYEGHDPQVGCSWASLCHLYIV